MIYLIHLIYLVINEVTVTYFKQFHLTLFILMIILTQMDGLSSPEIQFSDSRGRTCEKKNIEVGVDVKVEVEVPRRSINYGSLGIGTTNRNSLKMEENNEEMYEDNMKMRKNNHKIKTIETTNTKEENTENVTETEKERFTDSTQYKKEKESFHYLPDKDHFESIRTFFLAEKVRLEYYVMTTKMMVIIMIIILIMISIIMTRISILRIII